MDRDEVSDVRQRLVVWVGRYRDDVEFGVSRKLRPNLGQLISEQGTIRPAHGIKKRQQCDSVAMFAERERLIKLIGQSELECRCVGRGRGAILGYVQRRLGSGE